MPEENEQAWRTLTGSLKANGLNERHAVELVNFTRQLQRDGLPVKVFPKGIPNPDGGTVHTVFKPDQLSLLQALLEDHRIDSVRIFPKGIPNPDVFHAEIAWR